MPKHRQTVFCVVRTQESQDCDHKALWVNPIICAACFSDTRAEELRDVYAQDMIDRHLHGFKFEVQISTYYDE